MHQIIRNDQSSLVKVSNGTISATYRIFTTAYHNKMIGDPPKHLQVTDLTQFVIDSLCLGYKFLPPSILPTSDSYTFQSSLVDPILEASLTSLLTINISTGSSTSSLLILTPILDGSYASRIKYLSHNLKVPLLYIQAGLILLESARGQCTLAASLKRTLRCCSVLEPCVVLIEDLHLLCPSPGSTRFNSDPATYSETAKVVTQFVQNCYNKKSKQDYATSSSSSFIKIIGICQISNQLGVNYSSVLSMNVSNSFQETVTMPFPDTVTRRHIVHSALNKALRFDISIEDNRALNAWSDKRIGMSSQSLLAYAHLQLQIAHTLSPRKKSTPESISSQKDIRFQNHQNSSQIIGDILGSVSDVYTIKLQSIVDPMAVAVFTNIIDNSTVDKGANLLSSISRIHLQTDNKSQSVNISSDATVSAIKVPKSINFGRIKGHESVKKEITQVVLWPRWFPHIFQTYRVRPATGILLYGPPGTGKSLFPSVLASELGCHLVNIRLNDVIKGSIGSGERALRETFAEAKKSAPSILFIDEFQVINITI